MLAASCDAGSTTTGDDDGRQREGSEDDDSDDEREVTQTKPDGGRKQTSSGTADGGRATKRDASPDESVDESRDEGADEGDKTPAGAGDAVPCAIEKIVEAHCLDCHGAKPQFGATFSLTTLADFQGPADSAPTKKMHEVALTRVQATDKRRMPPVSNDALSAPDLKALVDWLAAGAEGGTACTEDERPAKPDEGEAPSQGGSGGASAKPIDYQDPDLKCYPFTAFTQGDRSKAYSVPTTPDLYVAFNMKAPWKGTQYVRSFRSIVDNAEVLHHWLFFKQSADGAETVRTNVLGVHPDGEMLYGWAPGGDDLYFDPDVAMEVDGSVLYQLELHYNNKTGSPKPDASGVEICVTPNKPAHVAGLSWVGTDSIAGTSATGRCAHTSKEPVHLIVAQPHMHIKGKHMKVTVDRKGGSNEVIHDQPFDFENQRSYIFEELVLAPGDVMNTTCEYSSPASFGKATSAEMCYFFSIHWPAGALVMPGTGTILHGANSCM